MASLLAATYAALVAAAADVPDGSTPTGAVGWTAQDLLVHLHADCVRALVAVHSPAGRPADVDAVSYWRDFADPERAARDRARESTRVEAALYSWEAVRERHAEAAAAAVDAFGSTEHTMVVATQGHAITVADLSRTLAVEATLHHFDLVAHLPGQHVPPDPALALTREVCEQLLGRDLEGWPDHRVALIATGRATPSSAEAADLAGVTFPVIA